MLSQQPHPTRIPREDHNVSRSQISQNALNVLYRLKDAGFGACLVGGGVRDLLLGRRPKDFDVVTDARPEQVRRLFRHARIVGRRFKIVHVVFKDEVIEVSTFRGPMDDNTVRGETGMILRDNEYGGMDDDVWRRDFACNALYYDIADFSIIDYTGGVSDVREGRLRLIGDPETRYREDPVRMLRAARFRAKLGFDLDELTRDPLPRLGELLLPISSARLFDESLKLFQSGHGLASFEVLRELDLFKWLFPELDRQLDEPSGRVERLVRGVLASTDHRMAENLGVNPAFLFAVLLWEGVRQRIEGLAHQRVAPEDAMDFAMEETLRQAIERIAIPRRLTDIMRQIWALQPALDACPDGAERRALLGHGRFRAALDMLCLRAESGEPVGQACGYWRDFEPDREVLEQAASEGKKRKPRRRRRPRRKKPA
ncbi:MAG: polynucleotide adenylyltransferase PcnB [Halothiobacillaceae bacterium]